MGKTDYRNKNNKDYKPKYNESKKTSMETDFPIKLAMW